MVRQEVTVVLGAVLYSQALPLLVVDVELVTTDNLVVRAGQEVAVDQLKAGELLLVALGLLGGTGLPHLTTQVVVVVVLLLLELTVLLPGREELGELVRQTQSVVQP